MKRNVLILILKNCKYNSKPTIALKNLTIKSYLGYKNYFYQLFAIKIQQTKTEKYNKRKLRDYEKLVYIPISMPIPHVRVVVS